MTTPASLPKAASVILLAWLGVSAACSTKEPATVSPQAEAAEPEEATASERPESETWLSHTGDRFEIHSTSTAELERAREELEHAAERFRHYFGQEPPQLAVVVFDAPEQMNKFDSRRFREQDVLFLPWISEAYIAKTTGSIRSFPDLGLILGGGSSGARVIGLVSQKLPDGIDLRSGDVVVGLAAEAIDSPEAFAQRYAEVEPGRELLLKLERDQETLEVRLTKPQSTQTASAQGDQGSQAKLREARPLSHEACHVLLIGHAFSRKGQGAPSLGASKMPTGDYGHPDIPDWFDEAFATLCEFPELQDNRRKLMRDKLSARIPLTELFTMEHPMMAAQAELMRKAREQGSQGGVGVVISDGDDLVTERAAIFYSQTLSVAEFLAEREGADFIGRLAEGLIEGESTTDVLKRASQKSKDLRKLEKDWLAWLKKTT